MSPFSKEQRHQAIEEQNHKCLILGIEVDVLEGHHAVPQCKGGSNHRINLEEVAGFNAYSVYGVPVEDVHEKLDRLAIDKGIYLHPITKEYVSRDQMPSECFRSGNFAEMPKIRKSNKEKKHKKHHPKKR